MLDRVTQELLTSVLAQLASAWRDPDCGFWEIRGGARHYTHSKLSAQIAFDRALRLARTGALPNDDAPKWAREVDEIQSFVESRCWSDQLGDTALRRRGQARHDDAARVPEAHPAARDGAARVDDRSGTPRARRRRAAPVPASEAVGQEGAFVASSFWLADALARADRLDDAADVMEATVALANDVGLYAEEIDATTNEFLGNFPQGLSHLALAQAATAIAR